MAEIKLKKKLIYAGDAYKAILEADPKLTYCIERIKAVDAVEVVRCKDCRYCQRDGYGLWCFNDYEHSLQPDDFCSYGERKDNE